MSETVVIEPQKSGLRKKKHKKKQTKAAPVQRPAEKIIKNLYMNFIDTSIGQPDFFAISKPVIETMQPKTKKPSRPIRSAVRN